MWQFGILYLFLVTFVCAIIAHALSRKLYNRLTALVKYTTRIISEYVLLVNIKEKGFKGYKHSFEKALFSTHGTQGLSLIHI